MLRVFRFLKILLYRTIHKTVNRVFCLKRILIFSKKKKKKGKSLGEPVKIQMKKVRLEIKVGEKFSQNGLNWEQKV